MQTQTLSRNATGKFLLTTLALALGPAWLAGQPAELDPLEGRWERTHPPLFAERGFEAYSGGGRGYLEVPRGATYLPGGLLEDFQVAAMDDIPVFAPGVTANAQFGHLTTPTVRGDTAESYLNGQRRSNNLFGYRPVMNAVESVELVRGAATPVFGPGFHSGGYVNFRTKRPDLEENRRAVSAGLGSWAPDGGSWGEGRLQLDISQVLEPGVAAWRMSLEMQESETFMDSPAAANNHRALFGSYRRRGESGWELVLSGEFLWQNAPQLLGVNRPTPELVRSGEYFLGEGGFADFGSGPAFVLLPPDVGPDRGPIRTGAGLISAGDRSRARVGWLQAEVRQRGERVNFTNRTLIEGVDRERVHDFEYFEFVDQWTWENRSEWTVPWAGSRAEGEWTAGVTVRWEERRSFVNFFNEVPFAFDLSGSSTVFSIRERYPELVVPGIPGPGGLEFFGLPFSPETTHSGLWNPAVFAEGAVRWDDRWELLVGLRADGYRVRARDPITPAGEEDRLSTGAWSGSASLLYAATPRDRLYLTFSDTNAVEGSIAGGGIMLNADGRVNRDNLHNRSRLLEAGWRRELEGSMVLGLTAFHQERQRLEIRGPRNDIEVRGLEADLLVEVARGTYGFFNASWSRGDFRNSAPGQLGGRSIYDLYAPGTGPQGAGTGLGYDFFFVNQVPPGDYRIPGWSGLTAAAGWSWELERRWNPRLRAWGEYQSRQSGNLDAEYWIPAQFTLNAGATVRGEGWRLSLQAQNLTNERNWMHNGQTFFNNQMIFRAPPRRVSAEVAIEF